MGHLAAPTVMTSSPLAGLKVLIVEDEAVTAAAAMMMLDEAGAHSLGPCESVADALTLIGEQRVDLALLDVNLNGMRSNAIAAALTAKKVPFVAATGYGIAAALAGASIILEKPYTPEQLRAALEEAVAATC